MMFLFKQVIFRFHVNFQGVYLKNLNHQRKKVPKIFPSCEENYTTSPTRRILGMSGPRGLMNGGSGGNP